ncbi:type I-U CRISPR-associated protein Csb2 [Candidatus Poriferisodalis sp.]|uniref:type I-G CRISPR-associated protein Csb2 n=1 Tax=Candidatus Poriferisodalis sp. TaxID=3101277 RepID=UPI003B02B11B
MTVVEVTLLTGRYVATAHHDRLQHEWPPHPARLFSALVATWADAEVPDAEEKHALEWLERQDAPAIAASPEDEVAIRSSVSHFVPVNDAAIASGSATAAEVLPEGYLPPTRYAWHKKSNGKILWFGEKGEWVSGRGKQERQFPSVTPDSPVVTFAWDQVPEPHLTAALDELLGRVTRIGHSSSLVSCRLVGSPPAPTIAPGEGSMVLRCTQRGQLAALEQAHSQHLGVRPRALPFVGVRYSQVRSDVDVGSIVRPDIAGDLVVFEIPADRRRMPMTRTVELTEALRGAVFHHAEDPLPEGLSGHRSNSSPSRDPHVAFLSLPNVGHAHADGRVMGLAVLLPEGLDELAARAAYRAIGRWEQSEPPGLCRLTLARGDVIDLQRKQPPFELSSLRSGTWARASRSWASATPIALPKNPGRLARGSPSARAKAWAAAEAQVRQSCVHVGLPEPEAVAVSLDPLIAGVRGAAAYPAFVQGTRRGEGVRRRLVHAAVRFGQEIQGPLTVGSGRFLGLGLMRPVPDWDPSTDGSGEE